MISDQILLHFLNGIKVFLKLSTFLLKVFIHIIVYTVEICSYLENMLFMPLKVLTAPLFYLNPLQ